MTLALQVRYSCVCGVHEAVVTVRQREPEEKVTDWMDDIILSYRVGKRKPASEIFVYALRRAEVQPHQAWYVDDLSDFVVAAERVGMRGVLYRTAPELADALGVW